MLSCPPKGYEFCVRCGDKSIDYPDSNKGVQERNERRLLELSERKQMYENNKSAIETAGCVIKCQNESELYPFYMPRSNGTGTKGNYRSDDQEAAGGHSLGDSEFLIHFGI